MPGTSQTGGDICERLRAEIAGQIVSGELSIQEACAQHQLSPELLLEWVAAFRQASVTAFDEQVRRTLAEQGVDVSTLASAEFQGDLGEFTIADLIQTLTLGDRDGVITVSHEGRESRIWCAGGEIIDAESGRLTGVPAVHRMLALERGRVRASFHRIQRARRVHASTMELLLEGARRSDECRVLRSRLGSGAYQSAAPPERQAEHATATEQALLREFQVPCGVAHALAESELGDLETLTTLARLIEHGRLVPIAGASAAPPDTTVSNPPLVLSFARFPTQPATPRARQRWALGMGLLALALLTVPRYLLASRAEPAPPEPAAAAGQLEATAQQAIEQSAPPPPPPALPPREREPNEAATEAAPVAMARGPGRVRRRVPSSPTAAAAADTAPLAAGMSATRGDSTTAASTPPRIQLIELRRPQMQILE